MASIQFIKSWEQLMVVNYSYAGKKLVHII
jgi:hypothetical protein